MMDIQVCSSGKNLFHLYTRNYSPLSSSIHNASTLLLPLSFNHLLLLPMLIFSLMRDSGLCYQNRSINVSFFHLHIFIYLRFRKDFYRFVFLYACDWFQLKRTHYPVGVFFLPDGGMMAVPMKTEVISDDPKRLQL